MLKSTLIILPFYPSQPNPILGFLFCFVSCKERKTDRTEKIDIGTIRTPGYSAWSTDTADLHYETCWTKGGKNSSFTSPLNFNSDATSFTYWISQKCLASLTHSADSIVHIPLPRKAIDTSVQGLRHCLGHLNTYTHKHTLCPKNDIQNIWNKRGFLIGLLDNCGQCKTKYTYF